jgi:hypothetical protein
MFMQSLKFIFICMFVLTTFCTQAQEGRVLMTKEVSMEARFFGNRYYVAGEKVSWRDFAAELKSTPKARAVFQEGRNVQIASVLVGLPASILFGHNLTAIFDDESNTSYLVVGLAGILCSYALEYESNVLFRKSIALHNSSPAVGARLLFRPGSIVLQF